MFGHARCGAHINARLNRQNHAGAQDARGAADDVLPGQGIAPHAGIADLGGLGIRTAVMHIHAQPVPGAVHVKREIGALFNHVVQGAHHLGIKQPQVEHALGQHFDGRIMRIGETGPCAGGVDGGHLRGQHQFVQIALRPGEAAVGRKGAGDVRGIAIELAARVDQHQFAIAHRARVGAVMQHASVGTGRDDRAIGRALRAMAAKLVQ